MIKLGVEVIIEIIDIAPIGVIVRVHYTCIQDEHGVPQLLSAKELKKIFHGFIASNHIQYSKQPDLCRLMGCIKIHVLVSTYTSFIVS